VVSRYGAKKGKSFPDVTERIVKKRREGSYKTGGKSDDQATTRGVKGGGNKDELCRWRKSGPVRVGVGKEKKGGRSLRP